MYKTETDVYIVLVCVSVHEYYIRNFLLQSVLAKSLFQTISKIYMEKSITSEFYKKAGGNETMMFTRT